MDWNLREAVEHCREQGAPENQQALVELLREVQAQNGGVIPAAALGEIGAAFGLKDTFLAAVVKRYPSLRTEAAPHRLEICGGERCQKRDCRDLQRFVEYTYQVKRGGASLKGGFTYQVTGCMKNCPKGPNIKWDGKLYSGADKSLIQSLIKNQ